MEWDYFVFHNIRGKRCRKVKQGQQHQCGETEAEYGMESWKNGKSRPESAIRFRSQIGFSAKSHMGAHEPRLQVCRINGQKPRKNKSRNKSYVSSVNYQPQDRVWDCVNGLLKAQNSDKLPTQSKNCSPIAGSLQSTSIYTSK